MKAYKITLLVIDSDNVGREEIVCILEDTKYPNWCISPEVIETKEGDIGDWLDDHPLNTIGKQRDEYIERLFKTAIT